MGKEEKKPFPSRFFFQNFGIEALLCRLVTMSSLPAFRRHEQSGTVVGRPQSEGTQKERTMGEDWDEQRRLPRYLRENNDVMVQVKILTMCVCVCVMGQVCRREDRKKMR